MIFNNFILSILLFTLNWSLAHEKKAQSAIESFAKLNSMKSASISFLAVRSKDQSVVASFDAHRTLVPASTAKLWSTAAAFEILGASYKPKTVVSYSGNLSTDGVLRGNLFIEGFGDVTLGSSYFVARENMLDFFQEWISILKSKNIKSIEGNIYTDASALGYFGVPEGWTWSDMGNYYGAFPSGLSVFDNVLELYYTTSKNQHGETRITKTNPIIEGFRIENHVTSAATSSDNAYVFAAPYGTEAFVTGTLPVNQQDFIVKAAIQNPEDLLAKEFYKALIKYGVDVFGKPLSRKILQDKQDTIQLAQLNQKKTLLFTHYGKELLEVLKIINHRSNNLFAEHLLHWIALEKEGIKGYHNKGVAILNSFWKSKFDVDNIRLMDGSGLSRSNNVSAEHFVKLLNYMKNNTLFESTLPISAQTGTLKNFCSGQPCAGKIKAKSGSINGVRAYAGYLYKTDGEKILFAFLVNNYSGNSSDLTAQMEHVMNAML